jgi:hypothetical protein
LLNTQRITLDIATNIEQKIPTILVVVGFELRALHFSQYLYEEREIKYVYEESNTTYADYGETPISRTLTLEQIYKILNDYYPPYFRANDAKGALAFIDETREVQKKELNQAKLEYDYQTYLRLKATFEKI